MKNIGNIIKTLQNIMRKDPGVSGDAQRIEQLGWLITLKILDDKNEELKHLSLAFRARLSLNLTSGCRFSKNDALISNRGMRRNLFIS